MAMTDKKTVQVALWLAIDYEESLIEAYRDSVTGKITESEGVQIARRRIKAFKRVLDRYYGGEQKPGLPIGKAVSIQDLLKDAEDRTALQQTGGPDA